MKIFVNIQTYKNYINDPNELYNECLTVLILQIYSMNS